MPGAPARRSSPLPTVGVPLEHAPLGRVGGAVEVEIVGKGGAGDGRPRHPGRVRSSSKSDSARSDCPQRTSTTSHIAWAKDYLPRSAEVEALFEDSGRPWEIAATEVDETEGHQPEAQCVRMIGCLGGLHGSLGVSDGLIESTKLGEHVGEKDARGRQRDKRQVLYRLS